MTESHIYTYIYEVLWVDNIFGELSNYWKLYTRPLADGDLTRLVQFRTHTCASRRAVCMFAWRQNMQNRM